MFKKYSFKKLCVSACLFTILSFVKGHTASSCLPYLLEKNILQKSLRYSQQLASASYITPDSFSKIERIKHLNLPSFTKDSLEDSNLFRQCKLIFSQDKFSDSSTYFLESHNSTKIGTTLLFSSQYKKPFLPPFYDIRSTLAPTMKEANTIFPIYDQGKIGSCAANAAAAAMQYHLLSKNRTLYAGEKSMLSRLYIYYNIRSLQPWSSVTRDTGATIAATIASVINYGAYLESLWPYSDHPQQFKKAPLLPCYLEARKFMGLDNLATASIPHNPFTLETLKKVLCSNYPVLIGLRLFSSFNQKLEHKKGTIIMPNLFQDKLLGGHALMMTGYNDEDQTFTARNSWGPDFGDEGYCYIPYEYITNPELAGDFWFLTRVGQKKLL